MRYTIPSVLLVVALAVAGCSSNEPLVANDDPDRRELDLGIRDGLLETLRSVSCRSVVFDVRSDSGGSVWWAMKTEEAIATPEEAPCNIDVGDYLIEATGTTAAEVSSTADDAVIRLDGEVVDPGDSSALVNESYFPRGQGRYALGQRRLGDENEFTQFWFGPTDEGEIPLDTWPHGVRSEETG